MDSVVSFLPSETTMLLKELILFPADSPEPGTIDNIDVQPFPISLVTGSSLTIAATLTLNEAVPTGATVSLDLKKEGLIPLPIPCLEIPDSETGEILHIGSW